VCIFLLTSALAGTVAADPIQILPSRRINGSASITDDQFLGASEHFGQQTNATGVFDAVGVGTAQTDLARLTVEASQHTTVDPSGHFFGSGSIGVSGLSEGIREVNLSRAESELTAQFELTRPTLFRFSATMMQGPDGEFVQASILGGPGNDPPLLAFVPAFGMPVHIDRDGVLMPGSYLFGITATTGAIPTLSATASFDFDLSLDELAATPEPASLVLVAFGGATLFIRRRKGAVAPAS
jgi:hypothetical protein